MAVTAALVRDAADLAEIDALRGYDAIHLAAAITVGVDVMASADRQLCASAASHDLNVFDPNAA